MKHPVPLYKVEEKRGDTCQARVQSKMETGLNV